MKAKLVLLLLAAMGSTALVASAQTPSTVYVVGSSSDGQSQDVVARAPAPPPPPGIDQALPVPMPPAPPGAPAGLSFYARPVAVVSHAYSAEEHNLARQAETFAQQLAAAKSDSDREKIKGQLAEILEKQFDQRQKRHEDEIKQLEAQIKTLRDQIDKRQENRREIVSARLDQILKEAQGLGW